MYRYVFDKTSRRAHIFEFATEPETANVVLFRSGTSSTLSYELLPGIWDSPNPIINGKWRHACIVVGGGKASLYEDGALTASNSLASVTDKPFTANHIGWGICCAPPDFLGANGIECCTATTSTEEPTTSTAAPTTSTAAAPTTSPAEPTTSTAAAPATSAAAMPSTAAATMVPKMTAAPTTSTATSTPTTQVSTLAMMTSLWGFYIISNHLPLVGASRLGVLGVIIMAITPGFALQPPPSAVSDSKSVGPARLQHLHGKVDEFRVYFRALTADEVQAIYAYRGGTHLDVCGKCGGDGSTCSGPGDEVVTRSEQKQTNKQ